MEVIVPKRIHGDFINLNGRKRLKELTTLTIDDISINQSDLSIPDFIFLGPIFIASLNVYGGNGFNRKLIVIDHAGLLPNDKGILPCVVLRTDSTYNDYSWLESYNMFDKNNINIDSKENALIFDNTALDKLVVQLVKEFNLNDPDLKTPCVTMYYDANSVRYDTFQSNIAYIPAVSIGELENKAISKDLYGKGSNYYATRYLLHDYKGIAGFFRLIRYFLPNNTEVLYKSSIYNNYTYDALLNFIDLDYLDSLIKDYPGQSIFNAERIKRFNRYNNEMFIEDNLINTLSSIWPVLNDNLADRFSGSRDVYDPLYRRKENGLKEFFKKFLTLCNIDVSYLLDDGTNVLPYHEFDSRITTRLGPDTIDRCLPYLKCLNNRGLALFNKFPEAVNLLNSYFNNHIDECFYLLQIALIENQLDNYLTWDFIRINDESIMLYDSLFKFDKFLQTYFKSDIDDKKKAFMFIFGLKTVTIGHNTTFSKIFSLGSYHKDIDKISFDINELIKNVSNQYLLFEYILCREVLINNYLEVK